LLAHAFTAFDLFGLTLSLSLCPQKAASRKQSDADKKKNAKKSAKKDKNLCHQFSKDGTCKYGEKCRFTHKK
jgi:hypothetical protein